MSNTTSNIAKVKGHNVQVGTETQIGKNNGEKYVSVRLIKYGVNLHSKGAAPIIGYGKPQWVRDSLIER